MGIQGLSAMPPIKGTIRLGIKKKTARNSEYPQTVPTFVLKDAPEVAKYYGDDPKEIDIRFITANLDSIIPTWYKKFSPSTQRGDTVIPGTLVCFGNGPLGDAPGVATWRERKYSPKEDPMPPKDGYGNIIRPCRGKGCPDAWDAKGNRACKQVMQVFCVLPLVSAGDIYEISTTAWESIRSFHALLNWHTEIYGADYIPVNYYKISRMEKRHSFFNEKKGEEESSIQYNMHLFEHNRAEFEERYFDRLTHLRAAVKGRSQFLMLPTQEQALALPVPDLFPTIRGDSSDADNYDGEEEVTIAAPLTPEQQAEPYLRDPDIQAAIAELEALKGSPLSDKVKNIAIQKKLHYPDVKEAVLASLREQFALLRPKQMTPGSEVAQALLADEMAGLEDQVSEPESQPSTDTLL